MSLTTAPNRDLVRAENDIAAATEALKAASTPAAKILAGIAMAHALDDKYIATNFSLGSSGAHGRRVGDYSSYEVRAAARLGFLSMFAPSEYHSPRWSVNEGKSLDDIDPAALENAIADLVLEDNNRAAYSAKEYAAILLSNAQNDARTPKVGNMARVVAGRKIAKGTEAEVIWYGKAKVGYGYRVGLRINGKVEFTNADNVENIPTPEQLDAIAKAEKALADATAAYDAFYPQK